MSGNKGKIVLIGLTILGIIILVLGVIFISSSSIYGILIMLGIVTALISFFVYGVRYHPYGCCFTQTRDFDDEALNKAVLEAEERNQPIVSTIYKYKETVPTKDAICMISKMSLSGRSDILQCVFCRSVFIGEYLREWIEENGTCPVCKEELKVTLEKKAMR